MKPIFTTRDEYGAVEVLESRHHRYLSFGSGDEQGCMAKAAPHVPALDYTRAMLLPLLFGRPTDVLLLGLGAGSLATALHRAYRSLALRAVELRPAVIDVAQRFFELPQTSRLQLITADACDYVLEQAELLGANAPGARGTDLILCDLYSADRMEPRTFDPHVVRACASLLGERGWLVINCWDEQSEESPAWRQVASHFEEIRCCTVATGNWLLFASRQRNPVDDEELAERCRKLSRKLDYDLSQYLALL